MQTNDDDLVELVEMDETAPEDAGPVYDVVDAEQPAWLQRADAILARVRAERAAWQARQ